MNWNSKYREIIFNQKYIYLFDIIFITIFLEYCAFHDCD